MRLLNLMIVLATSFAIASCSTPPDKDGGENSANSEDNSDANGTPNAQNSDTDPDLLAWCAANQQEVICTRPDGFEISLTVNEDCGQFARPECGVTPELLQTCIDAIEECPQSGTAEEHFGETTCFTDELACTFAPPNNANNVTPNNMTTAPVYTEQFQEVATTLRDNCLQAGCHGPASESSFWIASGTLATEAEIEQALGSSIPAETGNRLVTPGSPEESALYEYISIHREGRIVDLLAEEEQLIFDWIAEGAVYRE